MKTPPPDKDKPAFLPEGWTKIGWARELRRRADLCAGLHPERAHEFRDWAEIHEREARADEAVSPRVSGIYGGVEVTAG